LLSNFVSGKRAGDFTLLDKYFCNGLAQKEKRPDIDIYHIVQSFSVNSTNGARRIIPALFTRISTCRHRLAQTSG